MQLQVSEGTAVRKLEESRKKVTKLEAMVLRLEQKIDDKDSNIYYNKKQSQNKVQHLKRNLHVSSGRNPVFKLKFQAFHLLCLHRPVSVGPGRKPQRPAHNSSLKNDTDGCWLIGLYAASHLGLFCLLRGILSKNL